jgi:transposase
MTWEVPDRTEDHHPGGACSCGADLADAADLGVARSYQQEEIPAAAAERVQQTCMSPGAPAAGPMSRPARRASRIPPCPSGRGCGPWPFTWSSSSMSRWSGAGS